jgi:nitroimidazol reductase NimA-like FMN-containing flavoprotein (pyridoxamine 5'-phosphate oxidase superfamily)
MADTNETHEQQDLSHIAKPIIDSNFYLTLGTADENEHPWVSPLYYAVNDYKKFYWVSSPEAKHSRNLLARSQVSIVIFDSRADIGAGQAVYMLGVAEEVAGNDLEPAVKIFSDRSQAHGVRAWTLNDVQPPSVYRLYCATVSKQWILDKDGSPDRRISVAL